MMGPARFAVIGMMPLHHAGNLTIRRVPQFIFPKGQLQWLAFLQIRRL